VTSAGFSLYMGRWGNPSQSPFMKGGIKGDFISMQRTELRRHLTLNEETIVEKG